MALGRRKAQQSVLFADKRAAAEAKLLGNRLVIEHEESVRLYFTDLRHRARQLPVSWEGGKCSVDLLDATPIAIHAYVAVPEFGYAWVTADNKGEGYVDARMSLAAELASSRIARCERTADVYGLEAGLEEARSRLSEGEVMEALTVALVAGEDIELEHARDALESRDMTDHSWPVISATLFAERLGAYCIGVGPDWPADRTPDFLRPEEEWDLLSTLCNGTVLPNFWRWVEYERGHYRWGALDKIVEYAQRKKMAVKSFAIYWGGIGGTPPWFRTLSLEERERAVERWATDLVNRYRGRVSAWETVNEMHDWGYARSCVPHDETLRMTKLMNDLVGDLDPGTPRVINNCCIWGEYLQDWGLGGPWIPLTYLEDVMTAGVGFEGIGLQYYNPGRDLMECVQQLDRFAAFGKDIYVTEMGTPSDPRPRGVPETRQVDTNVGWRGPWTPERQAKWIEYWYTMAASRTQVKLMNWWDFDDNGAFIAHAGLLDGRGQPKPSYKSLLALCRSHKMGWH